MDILFRLNSDLRLEIFKYCIDWRSYFTVLFSLRDLCLINKEINALISSRRRYFINSFFDKPESLKFEIWRNEKLSISTQTYSWKNYIISDNIVFDIHQKEILKGEEIEILQDYLIDIYDEHAVVYIDLDPIFCFSIPGEFFYDHFLQIDGKIVYDGEVLYPAKGIISSPKPKYEEFYGEQYTLHNNLRIPINGKWNIYFREGDLSILYMPYDENATFYACIRERKILWIECVGKRDTDSYISNNIIYLGSKKRYELYTGIKIQAKIVFEHEDGGYLAMY